MADCLVWSCWCFAHSGPVSTESEVCCHVVTDQNLGHKSGISYGSYQKQRHDLIQISKQDQEQWWLLLFFARVADCTLVACHLVAICLCPPSSRPKWKLMLTIQSMFLKFQCWNRNCLLSFENSTIKTCKQIVLFYVCTHLLWQWWLASNGDHYAMSSLSRDCFEYWCEALESSNL